MEASSTTTPSKSKKAPRNRNKNKNKSATAAEAESANSQDVHGAEIAPPDAATNGHKDVNGEVHSNIDENSSSDIEALRQGLKDEKARSEELVRKVDALTTSANMVEQTSKKLKEDNSMVEQLEREVQSLRGELATALQTTVSDKSSQLELQKLQSELKEERIQHERDKSEAQSRITELQGQNDNLDAQYKSLLGRVSTIRTTLGERMKADAEELAQTKQTVEELEEQNKYLNDSVQELRHELENLRKDKGATSNELSSIRSRLNLAQQNWNKERDDLINSERLTREEYEVARQAMQDWEVIATEERAVRESLSDRVVELEEQLAAQKDSYERIASDYEKQGTSMDGLQRALQEIQEARKKELREIVENTQSQIAGLATKCEALDQLAKEAESKLTAAKQDLERALPFEKEVKEKNLLIGKLRHEAVTLNDHLRKALRMLKRDNADDKIDKQLVTNVFLQFVSIQRGDAKKYEVLQLIASVLDWNDEQREKAGLLRPGTSTNTGSGFFMSSLKTPPLTPFHRSPSTPALGDAYGDERDIWTSVLNSEK